MRLFYYCALLAGIAAFTGCRHDKPVTDTPRVGIVPDSETTPREVAEHKVLLDIGSAQKIEKGEANGAKPEDSVIYAFNGRMYYFANLHQFRLSIRQHLDSLKAVGSVFDYDTTYHPRSTLIRDSSAVFSDK